MNGPLPPSQRPHPMHPTRCLRDEDPREHERVHEPCGPEQERELDHNIRRHGFFSRQANHDRRELNALRARCGGNRRWDGDRDDRWRRW